MIAALVRAAFAVLPGVWISALAAIIIHGVGVLIARGAIRWDERKAGLMKECSQHRPRYDCTCLWMRAAGDVTRTDTPIIIPVPLGGGR